MALPAIVITTLAFLHILSAMGWLGGAILFVSVVAPGLRSMNPAANLEFLSKVGPKATRFFIGAATATLVFGLALLAAFNYNLADTIWYGMFFGLIAYIVALAVVLPNFRKADHLAKEFLSQGQSGPPPAELLKAIKRGGLGTVTVVLLLLTALAFMVATGFGY